MSFIPVHTYTRRGIKTDFMLEKQMGSMHNSIDYCDLNSNGIIGIKHSAGLWCNILTTKQCSKEQKGTNILVS